MPSPLVTNLKKIPTWAWFVVGGIGIGVAYNLYRGRGITGTGDEALEDAPLTEDVYTGGGLESAFIPQAVPGVPPVVPVIPESETVGAIGQAAIQELGGVFQEVLSGTISKLPTLGEYADLIGVLPGFSAAPPPQAATPQPPPPPPAPPPAPAPALPVSRVEQVLSNGEDGWRRGGIAGFLPSGAVGSKVNIRSGTNSNGHYTEHAFVWPDGTTRHYNRYSSGRKAGQWVGPFGGGHF